MGDLQQRLMATMHAVEIADGQGRPARGSGNVVRVVENLHDRDASPIEAARSREGVRPLGTTFGFLANGLARGLTPVYAAFIAAAGRAGTISTASPSSTGLPSTEQVLSKRARRLAG